MFFQDEMDNTTDGEATKEEGMDMGMDEASDDMDKDDSTTEEGE